MKQFCLVFALFCALFFAVSCDSGIKFNNPNDINSDAYQGDKDQITPDDDNEPADDTDVSDSEPTDTDDDSDTGTPEQPDNGDSEPKDDTDTTDTPDDDTDFSDTEHDDDTDSADTADEDYTEDITDTGTETGETRVQDCSELPENAQWNTVSAIVQSWDGEKWVPSSKTSFNLEGSEDECRFKCSTNYGWDGSKCDADTRNVYCDNLPEHAQWNDGGRNGTFAQTWNGEVWVPTSHDAVYSKTPAECGFICVTGYVWDGSQCDTAPTQSANCTGLPSGAEWNTTSSITQTWDGEKWVPESTAGVYNEAASTTECRFKCKTNYTWSGSACVANTKVSPCMNLPENAQWNTVNSITQTWSGEDWQPSTTGTYNTTSSTTQCRFKCNTNYTWNGSICAADTKVGNCPSKPANTVWNDGGANGTFTQTWNGEDWTPASYDSEYSLTAGICKYKCDTGYAWNSGICETASTRTAACQSKPDNTVWNTVSEITQTYTGSGWQPSTTPVYNETPSESECRYKCASGYNWNGSGCTSGGGSSLPECSSSTTSFPCKDSSTNYIWSAKNTDGKTWQQAKDHCTGLNTSNYGGFSSGWHLPTISELRTLIQNCSGTQMPPVGSNTCGVREDESVTCLSSSCWTGSACYSCSADSSGGHSKFGDTGWFWSSSLPSDYSHYAWNVNFYGGSVDYYGIDDYYGYVRCVR